MSFVYRGKCKKHLWVLKIFIQFFFAMPVYHDQNQINFQNQSITFDVTIAIMNRNVIPKQVAVMPIMGTIA